MASWQELQRRNNEEFQRKMQAKAAEKLYGHSTYKAPTSGTGSNSSSGSSSSSSSSSGGSYSGGGTISPRRWLFLKVMAVLVVLIVVGVIIANSYNSYYNGEWTYAAADKESSRSAQDYQDYLLSLDTDNIHWHVSYTAAPTDLWNYLLSLVGWDKETGYSMGGYATEDGMVYEYRFEGNDAGTGIPDGRYTLTKLDGTPVLVDETSEVIYKEGSDFYDTYAPKLRELSHDGILGAVLEKIDGGEHALSGSNDFWMEFIRKDTTMVYSYMLENDVTKISGGEFRAITTYPDDKREERWIFSYSDGAYEPDSWEGFTVADENTWQTNDDLGKLISQSFDGSGSVEFYKNGEEVLNIDVTYLPNGYDFEVDDLVEGYGKGLELDAVYRVNTVQKTLTKIVENENYEEVEYAMPLSAHQDTYDFLMSIVPHAYIRNVMDMDKAQVRKEYLGFITVYEMKDENGNVTADMRVAFDKIGEVNHYTAEDEYVKIELEY